MDNLRIERQTRDEGDVYKVVDGLRELPGGPYQCRQQAETVLVDTRARYLHEKQQVVHPQQS